MMTQSNKVLWNVNKLSKIVLNNVLWAYQKFGKIKTISTFFHKKVTASL